LLPAHIYQLGLAFRLSMPAIIAMPARIDSLSIYGAFIDPPIDSL
jgi:hypothetical protein